MRKRLLFVLILMSILTILSACGGTDSAAEDKDNSTGTTSKPKKGLNEITLEDLITKKDNNEAFYVLIYDAKKENVKNTKLLEAYDKALKDKDMTAYYLNIKNLDSEKNNKVVTLSEKYESHSGTSHNPFEDGGLAVVNDGQINSAFEYVGKAWLLNTTVSQTANPQNNTFLDDDLYSNVKEGVQKNIYYVKEQEVDLTY